VSDVNEGDKYKPVPLDTHIQITRYYSVAPKTRLFICKIITLSKLFLKKSMKTAYTRNFIRLFWKILCKFSIREYSRRTI